MFLFHFKVSLLLISGVVPTLQTARSGVTEDIANVLAGFRIMLSPDKKEVVQIVVYYMWCVEGECNLKTKTLPFIEYFALIRCAKILTLMLVLFSLQCAIFQQ